MKNRLFVYLFLLLGSVLLAMSLSLYTVDPRQSALVLHLGKVSAVNRTPGLYAKWPVVDIVHLIDTQVLTLEPVSQSHVTTMDKQEVGISYFAKWRVTDPQRYYSSTNGDENRVRTSIAQNIDDNLRKLVAQYPLADVLGSDRTQILDALHGNADQAARQFGVQIIDVRIRRINLSADAAAALSQHMASAQKAALVNLKAAGTAKASQIRIGADKEHDTIIAQAYQHAQETKGDADAKASAIYAAAYGKDPAFYAFYRSLSVYRDSLGNKNHILLLDVNSPFFHYLTPPKNDKP